MDQQSTDTKADVGGVERTMQETMQILGVGAHVRDVISGFTGIVTTVSIHLHGDPTAWVTPETLNDKGRPHEPECFSIYRLRDASGAKVGGGAASSDAPKGSQEGTGPS